MRKNIIILLAVIIAAVALASCRHAASIMDEEGRELNLEIQSMERVNIEDSWQWIYTSGTAEENPVLLWLDGGPGGSEVGWVRKYLGGLHEKMTIVCWDQRGTARSWKAADSPEDLQVEQFVDDVIALSEFLVERYDGRKIYLLGHSWGSVIGAEAAKRRPDLYAAYIGAMQHVNSIENDTIGWQMIHDGALERGEDKVVKKLQEYGKPPFYTENEQGERVLDGEAYYYLLSRLYSYSPHAPADEGFNSLDMFLAPEHTLIDRVNLIRGVIRGVKEIYPQLAFTDLEKEITSFEIPVFLINGRYDYSCVHWISERWYEGLDAPYKDLLWLEDSGHNGVYTEPQKVIDYFEEVILPVTQ